MEYRHTCVTRSGAIALAVPRGPEGSTAKQTVDFIGGSVVSRIAAYQAVAAAGVIIDVTPLVRVPT